MSKDFRPRTPPKSRSGNPMVTGILIGVFIGLAIAIVVAFFVPNLSKSYKQPQTPAQAAAPAASAQKPGAQPAAPAQGAPQQAAGKPRFDFYNILPGTEEPVQDQELKPAPGGLKEQYFLQAGSFQHEADANNLKAQLALLGIEATVQSANVPDKGIYHRVRIGPFSNIEDMTKVRTTLSQNKIEASLIKVREAPAAAAR